MPGSLPLIIGFVRERAADYIAFRVSEEEDAVIPAESNRSSIHSSECVTSDTESGASYPRYAPHDDAYMPRWSTIDLHLEEEMERERERERKLAREKRLKTREDRAIRRKCALLRTRSHRQIVRCVEAVRKQATLT